MTHLASEYVRTAQKYARLLSRGVISPVEYAQNLLSSAALYDLGEDTAREVAASVPIEGRAELDREISVVLTPGYQVPAPSYGGPGPTQPERDRIRIEYTQRVRACASQLTRHLGPGA
jgi:hypothetical protein